MNRRLIFGKYVDTGSWMHGLDPRAKIAGMMLFMAAVFMIDSLTEAAVATLFAIGMIGSTKIPLSFFWRALKPLLFIMLFIFLFHLIFESSGTRLYTAGPFTFYAGGLEKGGLGVLRMTLFVTFTALLTFTTLPAKLTQALETMMMPLRLIRISPQKVTLMITIALRFIPTILEETDKILKAQASRGLDFADQSLFKKARLLVSLLVPVTVSAVRRALDLAESMEARGYAVGKPRSSYEQLTWHGRDTWFAAGCCGLLAAMIVWGIWML